MAFDDQGDSGGAISQINVTPLVDVMLVLLVIFMVTAPIIQQGVAINLPKVTSAALPGEDEQLVRFAFAAESAAAQFQPSALRSERTIEQPRRLPLETLRELQL